MVLVGEFTREGRHFVALLDALFIYTHGRSRPDLYKTVREMVLHHVFRRTPTKHDPAFEVTVWDDGRRIFVSSTDDARLLAAVLRQHRGMAGLSLAGVASKLRMRSRNAYAIYEKGATQPTIGKLRELLDVVAPDLMLTVSSRGRNPQSSRRRAPPTAETGRPMRARSPARTSPRSRP